MRRFVEQADRGQCTLLPECLDDFIDDGNPVRVIYVFVDALDLAEMSFEGVEPAATGRPAYHPSVLLKLYIYGYLNRVQSSRRLEPERNANRLAPATIEPGQDTAIRGSSCFEHQPRRAALIAATSIFFMPIMASNARFASAPPAASASVNTRGVICQETPHLSLHQPHALSWPPLPTMAFQ